MGDGCGIFPGPIDGGIGEIRIHVAEKNQASVDGQALYERASDDAPVCTDCHRSHDIPDPEAVSWRVREPEMCGDCHTDPVRMGKYGLSTDVLRTYLADFHGTTAKLSGARTGESVDRSALAALCTDCHGVHDIRKVDDPDSPVLKANLAETCRKCHAGASDSFPSAWLSHYTPSWERAPMVKAVEVFYKLFIPFMIGGLVVQVLLHLWRVVPLGSSLGSGTTQPSPDKPRRIYVRWSPTTQCP